VKPEGSEVSDGVQCDLLRTSLRERDTGKQEFGNLISETLEFRTNREITMFNLGCNKTHIRILYSYAFSHKIQVTMRFILLQGFTIFVLVLFTV
jgi:hypothetical protein